MPKMSPSAMVRHTSLTASTVPVGPVKLLLRCDSSINPHTPFGMYFRATKKREVRRPPALRSDCDARRYPAMCRMGSCFGQWARQGMHMYIVRMHISVIIMFAVQFVMKRFSFALCFSDMVAPWGALVNLAGEISGRNRHFPRNTPVNCREYRDMAQRKVFLTVPAFPGKRPRRTPAPRRRRRAFRPSGCAGRSPARRPG